MYLFFVNPAHNRLILIFISLFKKKSNQSKDAKQTLGSLCISEQTILPPESKEMTGHPCSAQMTRRHCGIATIHKLPMSNITQLDGANHNYLRGTIHQTGKQEQWNKTNCTFTTALLSTHKPSLEHRTMSHSCCHGVAAHGAWHQLTPSGSSPCVWVAQTGGTQGQEGHRDRRDGRARSRAGNQPLPVSLLMSLSHVAPSPFSGTWTLHSTTARWLLWAWHVPGEPSSSQFALCELSQTQIPPQPYFPNTLWDWATSVNFFFFFFLLHVTACKKLFSGPGADLVLSQVMTHLTSGRTGVYYINASKQGRNSQSFQYQQWGKTWGKVLTPPNKTWQALWEQSSGSLSPIPYSNRGKGSCYTEETELKKNLKINLKGKKKKRQHRPAVVALALPAHFKWCGLQDVTFWTEFVKSNYQGKQLLEAVPELLSHLVWQGGWQTLGQDSHQRSGPWFYVLFWGHQPHLLLCWLLSPPAKPLSAHNQPAALFWMCSGNCSFSAVFTLQLLFWKNLGSSTAIFLGTASGAHKTLFWWRSHCWVMTFPKLFSLTHSQAQPEVTSRKGLYIFTNTHCVSSSSRIRRQDPMDTGGSNFLGCEF